MKKIIAILLTLVMMISGVAVACEKTDTASAIMTVKAEGSVTFNDTVYLPVTADHTIAGIKDEDAPVRCIKLQTVNGKWIAGWLPNGWAKASFADDGSGENVAVLTIIVDGEVLGLTAYDNITFTIDAPYVTLALEIIHNLCGEDAMLCNGTIGASMLWFTGDYASLIFFPSYSDAFRAGTATLNGGEDVTPLMIGTFNGKLHFGLKCGWWEPSAKAEEFTDVNVTAEAQAAAEAVATASATATSTVGNSGKIDNSGNGCWRNNFVLQVNVGSFVKNCIKFLRECTE